LGKLSDGFERSLDSVKDGFENLVDEQESMKWQLVRLLDYLDTLPVTVITVDKVEADDIIAYLVTHGKNETACIVSSDKDYLQLINENVTVYSPVKKKLYTAQTVKEEYDIHSVNFVLLKCILGDSSDNILGVKGLGVKTLRKHIPWLLDSEAELTLDEFIERLKSEDNKTAKLLLEHKERLELNHILMQLKDVDISGHAKMIALNHYDKVPPKLNQVEFIRKTIEDRFSIKYVQQWLKNSFHQLNFFS